MTVAVFGVFLAGEARGMAIYEIGRFSGVEVDESGLCIGWMGAPCCVTWSGAEGLLIRVFGLRSRG